MTRRPARASVIADASPAGPAPAIRMMPSESAACISVAAARGEEVVERRPDEREVPAVAVALYQTDEVTLPADAFEPGEQLLPDSEHRPLRGRVFRRLRPRLFWG